MAARKPIRGMLGKIGRGARAAIGGLAFAGAILLPSTGRPEVVERKGQKTADVFIGCVDSRLGGKQLREAFESENIKPFFIKVPGATATPAVLHQVESLVKDVTKTHGNKVLFRVHVVGHGSLDPKREQIPNGGYLNYELSKDPKRPQCGMKGGGSYLQELLGEMLKKGELWNGTKYVTIQHERELRQLIRDYYHLEERSLFDFLHDIPPVHQHVMQQIEDTELELTKRLPGARLQFFAGVRDHGTLEKGYQFYPLHASGKHATEDREMMLEENPLTPAYTTAQKDYEKLAPAEKQRDFKARTEPQYPQYHVIVDASVRSSLAKILSESQLKLEPEAGKYFTTVFDPSNPDPLAVSSHGYWLEHILPNAPQNIKDNATDIFVGPDPRDLQERLEETPIGRHLQDEHERQIQKIIRLPAK